MSKTGKKLVADLPTDRLFHGTSLIRAKNIQIEGFRTNFGQITEDHKISTYWGNTTVAESFAIKKAAYDRSLPVIISAKLEDVVASGSPRALRTYCDDVDVEYPDWIACYKATECLWVLGGRHVSNIEIHEM